MAPPATATGDQTRLVSAWPEGQGVEAGATVRLRCTSNAVSQVRQR